MRFLGLEIKRAQKRGKLPKLEEKSENKTLALQFGTYAGLAPAFAALPGFTESDKYMSALRTNATYCSKAVFSSVRIKDGGAQIHDWKTLDYLLQVRPNKLMNAATFWERVAYYYYHYNNAFIYKECLPNGEIRALWTIDPSECEFVKLKETGELIMRFAINGQQVVYPYECIIHVANTVVDNAIFGMSNKPLRRILNLINTNYQGIDNSITTSAYIRFLMKMNSKTSDDALKEKAQKITESYLDPLKKVGVIAADSSYELTELKGGEQKTANAVVMQQLDDAVCKYMGCPQEVMAGTADENVMTAYYERTIDPFLDRVSQELTEKIFTPTERAFGNKIVYSDRKLQYLPMSTRLAMFDKVRELGIVTYGTLGDLLGLPVPEDLRTQTCKSQNYAGNEQKVKPSSSKEDETDGGNNKTEVAEDETK